MAMQQGADTTQTTGTYDMPTAPGRVALDSLAAQLADFARERDWDQFHSPRNLLLALVGEVGELAELFQWRGEVSRGLSEFKPAEKEHVSQELADCLLYLVRLADVCGIDLGAAALAKIQLNAQKYPAAACKGRSDKYTAYAAATAAGRLGTSGGGSTSETYHQQPLEQPLLLLPPLEPHQPEQQVAVEEEQQQQLQAGQQVQEAQLQQLLGQQLQPQVQLQGQQQEQPLQQGVGLYQKQQQLQQQQGQASPQAQLQVPQGQFSPHAQLVSEHQPVQHHATEQLQQQQQPQEQAQEQQQAVPSSLDATPSTRSLPSELHIAAAKTLQALLQQQQQTQQGMDIKAESGEGHLQQMLTPHASSSAGMGALEQIGTHALLGSSSGMALPLAAAGLPGGGAPGLISSLQGMASASTPMQLQTKPSESEGTTASMEQQQQDAAGQEAAWEVARASSSPQMARAQSGHTPVGAGNPHASMLGGTGSMTSAGGSGLSLDAQKRKRFTEEQKELLTSIAEAAGWSLSGVPQEERDRLQEVYGISKERLQNFLNNRKPRNLKIRRRPLEMYGHPEAMPGPQLPPFPSSAHNSPAVPGMSNPSFTAAGQRIITPPGTNAPFMLGGPSGSSHAQQLVRASSSGAAQQGLGPSGPAQGSLTASGAQQLFASLAMSSGAGQLQMMGSGTPPGGLQAATPGSGALQTATPGSAGLLTATLPSAGLPTAHVGSTGLQTANIGSAGVPMGPIGGAGLQAGAMGGMGSQPAGIGSSGPPSMSVPPPGRSGAMDTAQQASAMGTSTQGMRMSHHARAAQHMPGMEQEPAGPEAMQQSTLVLQLPQSMDTSSHYPAIAPTTVMGGDQGASMAGSMAAGQPHQQPFELQPATYQPHDVTSMHWQTQQFLPHAQMFAPGSAGLSVSSMGPMGPMLQYPLQTAMAYPSQSSSQSGMLLLGSGSSAGGSTTSPAGAMGNLTMPAEYSMAPMPQQYAAFPPGMSAGGTNPPVMMFMMPAQPTQQLGSPQQLATHHLGTQQLGTQQLGTQQLGTEQLGTQQFGAAAGNAAPQPMQGVDPQPGPRTWQPPQ